MGQTLTANQRAIGFMAIAMSFLSANDAIMKMVGASMPVGQMMVVRGIGLCSFLAIGCWIGRQHVTIHSLMHFWSLMRGLSEVLATYLFIYSLTKLPLATATTIVFCFPILLTALSGPLFGERVGVWRWCAVIAGFIGVVLVTAPGTSAWQSIFLLPLGAAVFVAMRDVSTRYVASHISSGSVTMTTAFVVILGGLASLPWGWSPLTMHSLSWLTLCAVFIAISFFSYVVAVRTGELSLIAPVQYIVILWALAFGMVFWGEVPGLQELSGGLIIIGSGLLILYRERVQHKRKIAVARESIEE